MKAIAYYRYGPPEVLQITQLDRPKPEPGQVQIRVHAVEVTKSDCELRSFRFPVNWFWLPLRLVLGVRRPRRNMLGSYFSGEITEVGGTVSRFSVGDQVFGTTGLRMGAYAEYVCLPDSSTLAAKPENMSFTAAAAVPLGGLNALHFLELAGLRGGERILINGAGGSIGVHGVQIAKAMGAEVTATDARHKLAMLSRMGADYSVDYRELAGQLPGPASGSGYDVVFNTVAGFSYDRLVDALTPTGRFVTANPTLTDMFRCVITSRFTGRRAMFGFAGEENGELERLRAMIEDGQIADIVDTVHTPEDVASAHRRVEAETRCGAAVIAFIPES